MPFNPTLTTWLALNAQNSPSPTYNQDIRTGAQIPGGALNPGDYFDLTAAEAKMASYLTLPQVLLYAGRYRWVQLDSGATAANVKTGAIGFMVAGGQPQMNLVTSYDKGIVGAHTVVFLNAVTPGNWAFVQELGVASVLMGASITHATPASGDLINVVSAGVGDDPTVQEFVPASLGIALSPPSPNTLCLVQLCLPTLQG